ncbi:hypothetical protein HPB51_003045 [Rhipicephalus microplus]|uniref:CCHC-type domain-containing protein n=1 Tax=Rhipicephalus microplus TaxID=6941 RepID=A0A9J6EKF3_RHIMP|nr:hypothetical protein HPB51_003045 [Rhipicephalus microplus]
MCEAGEAPLCLTTATFAPTMCSVGAALGAALEASPELATLRNDENDQHYEQFQAMDTSAADISADSARKRRHGQLGLTAAKKKAAEQPTGSRLDASGDCSTTIGDGFPTATGIGQCVTAVNSDCDPPNSCAGWTVVASRCEKKRQKTGSPSQRDTLTAGEPSKSLSASNAKLKEERRREQKAQYIAKVNANMAKSARMPTFAKKDEHRVVVRPRGGLVVSAIKMTTLRTAIITAANIKIEEAEDDSFAPNAAQNIIVLSTPSEARSFRYGLIRNITVEERTQHREVCTTCGKIGHRKDVCPTPNARVCFACGTNNPGEDHAEYCKPRCKFCGGSHVTGAGKCKNKFKTPLQIKQRQRIKQNTEIITEMAPAKAPGEAALSRRFDFPEPGASGTRHEQNGVASRDRIRAEPVDVKWADVTSERPKEARPPRPAPLVQAHLSMTNKSDVNHAAMTQTSGALSRAAAATLKKPGKMPSGGGGGCSEQCKKETRELKDTVKKMEKAMEELKTAMVATQLTIKQQRGVIDEQRDAIRRLQEGGSRNEANNKMATDADEVDNGTPTNIAGNRFVNTTTLRPTNSPPKRRLRQGHPWLRWQEGWKHIPKRN